MGWSTAQADPFCLQTEETIGTTTLAWKPGKKIGTQCKDQVEYVQVARWRLHPEKVMNYCMWWEGYQWSEREIQWYSAVLSWVGTHADTVCEIETNLYLFRVWYLGMKWNMHIDNSNWNPWNPCESVAIGENTTVNASYRTRDEWKVAKWLVFQKGHVSDLRPISERVVTNRVMTVAEDRGWLSGS
jgi:hypothetical protein